MQSHFDLPLQKGGGRDLIFGVYIKKKVDEWGV
jgi:hypothetical protein